MITTEQQANMYQQNGIVNNKGIFTIEKLKNEKPDEDFHSSQPDDLAVLLRTSGSTNKAKYVTLSHRNIITGIIGSSIVNQYSQNDISLNWFDLDHIGALMRSSREIYLNCTQIQIASEIILKNPVDLNENLHPVFRFLTFQL